jgi:hypothetical protein
VTGSVDASALEYPWCSARALFLVATEPTPVTDERPDRPDSLDDVFVALADDQRRRVLAYLVETDVDRVPLDDLVAVADGVDTTDTTDGDDGVPAALRRNLRILAELGFLEYETGDGTVAVTPTVDYVAPFLAAVDESAADADRPRT